MLWHNRRAAFIIFIIFIGTIEIVYSQDDAIIENVDAAAAGYIREPNHLGPRTWKAGVECLEQFVNIYFHHQENFTRSYNLIITIGGNMSTPAAQIQEGFLKAMNEAVNDDDWPAKRKVFTIRIVSDTRTYTKIIVHSRDLVLADYYVIVVDQVAQLQRLMAKHVSKQRSWNPGARFLILFNNIDMQSRQDADVVAKQIFGYMMQKLYIHRVSVLYAIGTTEYLFIGSDYFSNIACRHLRLRKIGTCLDGQLKPSKQAVQREMLQFFGNFTMNNCTINVCTSIIEPYIESDCINGLEFRLLSLLRKTLHFETNISCSNEQRGILDTNGSWNGLLGYLNSGSCDLVMGGFYPDNEVFDSFWNSDGYYEDKFTWYYKVAENRPPFLALYSIFANDTWLCIILMLLLSWFFLWLFINVLPELKANRQFSLNGLNALGLTICASICERPVFNTGRIFFMALTLYGVNLITIYTSKLIAVFGDPGLLHQISTLEEAVKLNIPFGGGEENQDWFDSPEDLWIQKNYNNSPEFDETIPNLNDVRDGKRIILSSRSFVLQHPYADQLYAFPRNIFSSPIQMIMKAGFPFQFDLNKVIRYARDAGIFEKIIKDYAYNYTYLNHIAKNRPDFQQNVIVLTTEHLQGAFGLLFLGVCSSSVLFAAELIAFYIIIPRMQPKNQSETQSQRKKQPPKHKAGNMKQRRNFNKISRNCKKINKLNFGKKMTHLMAFKNNETKDSTQSHEYNVNVVHDIRFTPIKRRIIF